MLFIHTNVCRSRRFCRQCRSLDDESFRDGWFKVFELPLGGPMFECPYGLQWGFDGDGSLAGDSPDGKIRGLGDVIAVGTKVMGIKPCGGCRERQEELNRLSQAAARAVGAVVSFVKGNGK